MKKTIVCCVLGVLVSDVAIADNGNLYLKNDNDVMGSSDPIQLQVVAKKDDGTVVKTIETKILWPKQVVTYKLADFGIDTGRLSLYARDPKKSAEYNLCAPDYSYCVDCLVIGYGWTADQNANCTFAEE